MKRPTLNKDSIGFHVSSGREKVRSFRKSAELLPQESKETEKKTLLVDAVAEADGRERFL